MQEILIIEDDLTFSKILEGFLSKHGYTSVKTHSAKDGIQVLHKKNVELVLLDYRLPDSTGLEVLQQIKSVRQNLPVIIMTSFSDVRTAVKAIKAGAFEYITKPINPDELIMLIREALRKDALFAAPDDFVAGSGNASVKLEELVKLVAPTNLSVIIEGESGTGKERVARSIHALSTRAQMPFIAVDCGTLSNELAASELFGHVKGAFTGAVSDKTGQFIFANGGTLFLDEVGNLGYEVQIKLLRAIQERTVQPVGSNHEIKTDVRIITATNEDLTQKVRENAFREDLYHRLNEFKLEVPALRNRKEDLIHFIEFFREKANRELNRHAEKFDPAVLDILNQYDWPGNLRELKNTIKRAVLLTEGNTIERSSLPQEMLKVTDNKQSSHGIPENTYDLKLIQEANERQLIIKTLEEFRYNKSKAAKMLNIDRKTLYMKMEKYGIK